MSYQINPKQLSNVSALSSEQRFQHFISKVCDWEELWILVDLNLNFLIVRPENNIQYLPVWTHADYANQFAHIYPSFKPQKLKLNIFLTEWIINLTNQNIKVGVMPNLEITVWLIQPNDLKIQLENELRQYD